MFTAQQTLADAQDFYRDLKARTAALGRDPSTIKILPGIVPVIGSTVEEALRLERELDELIKPEYARLQLAKTLRVAPEDLPLDQQLPAELPDEDEIEGAKSRYTLIVTLARREKLTVRELIGRLGGGRGHRTFTGTPDQVADAIEQWFAAGAADGFNIMPPVLPSGLTVFVDEVVPILQNRGLFRTEYTGTTLRDHYGLRPAAGPGPKPPGRCRRQPADPDDQLADGLAVGHDPVGFGDLVEGEDRSMRIGSLPAATRSTYRWNASAGRSLLSPLYAVSRTPLGR